MDFNTHMFRYRLKDENLVSDLCIAKNKMTTVHNLHLKLYTQLHSSH